MITVVVLINPDCTITFWNWLARYEHGSSVLLLPKQHLLECQLALLKEYSAISLVEYVQVLSCVTGKQQPLVTGNRLLQCVVAGRPLLLGIRDGDSLNNRAFDNNWILLLWESWLERRNEDHVVPFSLLMTFTCFLTNSPGSTFSHINSLQLAAAAHRLKNEARATHKLWSARDNITAYGGGSVCRKDITSRGEQKKTLVSPKVCVCVCVRKSKIP